MSAFGGKADIDQRCHMLGHTDYEITEAESGEEALAAVATQRPDLILMDIRLPIMDGYTATRALQSAPAVGEGLSISNLKPRLF